jgi:hypothetical protein
MASTFSVNKNLELPGNGDYVNTWNIPLNGDMTILDNALGGMTSLNATSGSAVLTPTQYQKLILNVSGSIGANVVYTIPSGVGGQWVVKNLTSGGWSVIIASGGGGASAEVVNGTICLVACDGTNAYIPTNTSVPTGGNSNQAFYLNDITVTSNYTIPAGKNAGTFGPVTIASGVSVTVPSGSYWSIV